MCITGLTCAFGVKLVIATSGISTSKEKWSCAGLQFASSNSLQCAMTITPYDITNSLWNTSLNDLVEGQCQIIHQSWLWQWEPCLDMAVIVYVPLIRTWSKWLPLEEALPKVGNPSIRQRYRSAVCVSLSSNQAHWIYGRTDIKLLQNWFYHRRCHCCCLIHGFLA